MFPSFKELKNIADERFKKCQTIIPSVLVNYYIKFINHVVKIKSDFIKIRKTVITI